MADEDGSTTAPPATPTRKSHLPSPASTTAAAAEEAAEAAEAAATPTTPATTKQKPKSANSTTTTKQKPVKSTTATTTAAVGLAAFVALLALIGLLSERYAGAREFEITLEDTHRTEQPPLQAAPKNRRALPAFLAKRLAKAKAGDKRFVCDERDMALPVLFVGVQKSGSTTMFDDLKSTFWLRTDVSCERDDGNFWWGCKELHYFNGPLHHLREFNSLWGSCMAAREGLIAEFTPENFHYPSIPKQILKTYGPAYKEIVFLVGLREPLSRMLAAFANGLDVGWIYRHKRRLSFQEHVDEFLSEWDKRGRENWIPSLWKTNDYRTVDQGLYFYKLRNFIDAGFHLSQFVIYPGSLYIQHREDLDTNPVLEAVRGRLGKSVLRPTTKVDNTKVANKGHHKALAGELTNVTAMGRLQKEVFGPANRRLMEFLAKGAAEGMTLVGYQGKVGDSQAVGQWMESLWNF